MGVALGIDLAPERCRHRDHDHRLAIAATLPPHKMAGIYWLNGRESVQVIPLGRKAYCVKRASGLLYPDDYFRDIGRSIWSVHWR